MRPGRDTTAAVFIGHFAVGFAAKRLTPQVSLGAWVAAPLFLDLLWPAFLAAGIETVRIDPGNTRVTPFDLHDYPYSHSLLMAVVWALVDRGRWSTAILGVACLAIAVMVYRMGQIWFVQLA